MPLSTTSPHPALAAATVSDDEVDTGHDDVVDSSGQWPQRPMPFFQASSTTRTTTSSSVDVLLRSVSTMSTSPSLKPIVSNCYTTISNFIIALSASSFGPRATVVAG